MRGVSLAERAQVISVERFSSASELIGSLLEEHWKRCNMKRHERRSKQRRRRARDTDRARAHWNEAGRENEKNGKCCTNSDIKLIFFIMHQSSVLARAYFMQKQVLAFRSLLYFRDIYSDYTLFHGFVSLNSCLQAGHSSGRRKKQKQIEIDNSENDASYFRHMHRHGRQAGRPTPFIVTKGIK